MATSLSRSTDDKTSVANNEFLSFKLGAEEYGIDILGVQEIRGYTTSTKIANTPHWMKGVQDLLYSNVMPQKLQLSGCK